MPHENKDPSDDVLKASIRSYLAQQNAPGNAQYRYERVDLNGDGMREGLVLFTLPHNYWCGWSGCTFAVFEAAETHFSFQSEILKIRGPLIVKSSTSRGWRDLAVRFSGTGTGDKNVVLRFDGARYPNDPSAQREEPLALKDPDGIRLFY